jgi:DNA-binding NtrC family response regulator
LVPEKTMVALIDNSSAVRRACYDMLTSAGRPVTVFYSPETFVNSGAVNETDLLIIGRIRSSLQECEAIRWASVVRPELKTLLLNRTCEDLPSLIQLCHCADPLYGVDSPETCVEALKRALTSGALCN